MRLAGALERAPSAMQTRGGAEKYAANEDAVMGWPGTDKADDNACDKEVQPLATSH